jgi:hypothetical protein
MRRLRGSRSATFPCSMTQPSATAFGGARYVLVEPGKAEVAFVVVDRYQNSRGGQRHTRHGFFLGLLVTACWGSLLSGPGLGLLGALRRNLGRLHFWNLFPGCHRDQRLRLVIVVAAPVEGPRFIAAHQLSVPGGRMLVELCSFLTRRGAPNRLSVLSSRQTIPARTHTSPAPSESPRDQALPFSPPSAIGRSRADPHWWWRSGRPACSASGRFS